VIPTRDVYLVNDTNSAAGAFWGTFTDIAIGSTDGSARPIYNRQKTMALSVSCDAGVTDCWQIVGHPTGVGWAYSTTTVYYHGDHLGSSRFMSSYNGTPMWEATYLPYGQEWNGPSGAGPVSPNHYKFTGKERDPESGLDYFGARYYASAQGRFLSPDEFTGGPVDAFSSSDPLPPGPLPYADITNPQSLNKYTYTYNNPMKYTDPDGHAVETLWDAFNVAMGLASLGANLKSGNYGAAALDAAGVAVDGIATVVPFVPGGAGTAIRLTRLANRIDNLAEGLGIGRKLAEPIAEAFTKIDNIKGALDRKTLDAARRELKGEVVAVKKSGEAFDHVNKVREAQQGLINQIGNLKKQLGNSELTEAARKEIQRKISEASKLLDKTEEFVPR
jgi:RHS repeat-associated protein